MTDKIESIVVKAGYPAAARRAAGEILQERGFTNIRLGSAHRIGFSVQTPSIQTWKVDYLADEETQGGWPKAQRLWIMGTGRSAFGPFTDEMLGKAIVTDLLGADEEDDTEYNETLGQMDLDELIGEWEGANEGAISVWEPVTGRVQQAVLAALAATD